MCTKVPGVADRGCQPEPERKSLTLEYVDIKYPEDQWTHAYTGGSAAEATRDGGGGVYIRYNDGIAQITIATGKYSTIFKAEAEAIHNRTEQDSLFRLRMGHNRLNAHMYNKFKVGESEMCPCNADIMTAEHLLQHCPLHDAMRRGTWPEPTLLRDKLYGNLEELRRTAAFVRATSISI